MVQNVLNIKETKIGELLTIIWKTLKHNIIQITTLESNVNNFFKTIKLYS